MPQNSNEDYRHIKKNALAQQFWGTSRNKKKY